MPRATKRYGHRFALWRERSREPGLTALLVIEVALIFAVVPLAAAGLLPHDAVSIAFLLLVIATLIVSSHNPVAVTLVLISVVLNPLSTFLRHEFPSLLTDCLRTGGRVLAVAALSWVVARAVFGPGRITLHRVQGAVVLYLNFGLLFFAFFQLIDVVAPNAFAGLPPSGKEFDSGAGLLYFSFTTLTTTGYGDITPVHPMARNLANLEMVIGQLYPATLLARLVSLEVEHRRRAKED